MSFVLILMCFLCNLKFILKYFGFYINAIQYFFQYSVSIDSILMFISFALWFTNIAHN